MSTGRAGIEMKPSALSFRVEQADGDGGGSTQEVEICLNEAGQVVLDLNRRDDNSGQICMSKSNAKNLLKALLVFVEEA